MGVSFSSFLIGFFNVRQHYLVGRFDCTENQFLHFFFFFFLFFPTKSQFFHFTCLDDRLREERGPHKYKIYHCFSMIFLSCHCQNLSFPSFPDPLLQHLRILLSFPTFFGLCNAKHTNSFINFLILIYLVIDVSYFN